MNYCMHPDEDMSDGHCGMVAVSGKEFCMHHWFKLLQQQNEIYRKSNDIYKKALERIVTDSGGGSKVNHLNMVESCIKCAEQALQDAQKLAGGK